MPPSCADAFTRFHYSQRAERVGTEYVEETSGTYTDTGDMGIRISDAPA
jgi:hypothetical protein